MRPIKRITHLRQEQRRLRQREAELGKLIRRDWKSIRNTLHPSLLGRELLSSCTSWIGKKLMS